MMLHACFFCEAKVVRGTPEAQQWVFELWRDLNSSHWNAICPAAECRNKWAGFGIEKARAALRKSRG